jgi:hypothetical protein
VIKFIIELIFFGFILIWFSDRLYGIIELSIGIIGIAEALLYLAGRCDGAVSKDGQGFNGRDAEFGHSLANQLEAGRTLSPKQRAAATKMLTIYKKQLGRAGIIL